MLRKKLSIESLVAEHPLRRQWWANDDPSQLATTRFEMHHLASDLRLVEGVPGSSGLLKAMLTDAPHFADYRYELRIAAAAARASGQTLVRLGGKEPGPDVEVRAKSGHLCGIACFRANPITPHLQAAPTIAQELVANLALVVGSAPIPGKRVKMGLVFAQFPIDERARADAIAAFRELWRAPAAREPQIVRQTVTVAREEWQPLPNLDWAVQITLRLPVPAREKRRLRGKIESKIRHETDRWAHSYSGVPILAIEESDFSLGVERDTVKGLLEPSAKHPFAGVLTTWGFVARHPVRGRTCIEEVHWIPHPQSPAFHLGLETFGPNTEVLEKGHMLFQFHPRNAEEEWLIRPGTLFPLLDIQRVRPLSLTRRMTRIPSQQDRVPTAEDLRAVVRRLLPELSR